MSLGAFDVREGDVELELGDFFSLLPSFFLKLKGAMAFLVLKLFSESIAPKAVIRRFYLKCFKPFV